MKIVVYGQGPIPLLPTIDGLPGDEVTLYRYMYDLSGRDIVIVVLIPEDEELALRAATIAQPMAVVIRWTGKRFVKVIKGGGYRLYAFPDG